MVGMWNPSWGSLSCPHPRPLHDKGFCTGLSTGTSPTPNLGVVKMFIKELVQGPETSPDVPGPILCLCNKHK